MTYKNWPAAPSPDPFEEIGRGIIVDDFLDSNLEEIGRGIISDDFIVSHFDGNREKANCMHVWEDQEYIWNTASCGLKMCYVCEYVI